MPIFVLLVSAMLFFVYISPTWTGTIADTKTAIASDDAALKSAKDYADKQDDLEKQKNDIDPGNLARLTTLLPDSVDNVGLILSLNALAARSGLILSNIDVSSMSGASTGAATTPALAASVSPINSIDLSVSAAGPYGAFQKFLQGVEKSQRLLDVRNIVVTGSNTNLYTYQMTIRLYWLR
jgi:hypothetical protein